MLFGLREPLATENRWVKIFQHEFYLIYVFPKTSTVPIYYFRVEHVGLF